MGIGLFTDTLQTYVRNNEHFSCPYHGEKKKKKIHIKKKLIEFNSVWS